MIPGGMLSQLQVVYGRQQAYQRPSSAPVQWLAPKG
jgi:hypothetical protein